MKKWRLRSSRYQLASHLAHRGHNRGQIFEFKSGPISWTLSCLPRPFTITAVDFSNLVWLHVMEGVSRKRGLWAQATGSLEVGWTAGSAWFDHSLGSWWPHFFQLLPLSHLPCQLHLILAPPHGHRWLSATPGATFCSLHIQGGSGVTIFLPKNYQRKSPFNWFAWMGSNAPSCTHLCSQKNVLPWLI